MSKSTYLFFNFFPKLFRLTFCVVLCVLFLIPVFSKATIEDREIDSLQKLLNNASVRERPLYLRKIGYAYYRFGTEEAYSQALNNFYASLQESEALKDDRQIANSLEAVGVIFDTRNYIDKAENYYQKAYEIRRTLNDSIGIIKSLFELSVVKEKSGNLQQSIVHLKLADSLARISNRLDLKINARGRLGNAYRLLRQFDKAEKILYEALKLTEGVEKSEREFEEKAIRVWLAKLYTDLQNPKKSLEHSLWLYDHLDTLNLYDARETNSQIAKSFWLINDYEKAYKHLDIAFNYEFIIASSEGIKQHKEMEFRVEVERHAKEVAVLNEQKLRRNYAVYTLIGFLLFALVGVGALYNRYRLKKNASERIEAKNRELQEINMAMGWANSQIAKQKEALENLNESLTEAYRSMETDNRRKTDELEQARSLQLSMLPQKLPSIPDLEMAVFMQTASEVGGDYYDFYQEADGALHIAFGDAAGHGLKAAFLVTVAKSYYKLLTPLREQEHFLHELSRGLDALELEEMYMAMLLLKYKEGCFEMVSAGMPPIYIWRAAEKRLETVSLEGILLGIGVELPYQSYSAKLEKDDALILMSDGLPELVSPNRMMIEQTMVVDALQNIDGLSANSIVEKLKALVLDWSQGCPLSDDVTLMVLRRK